MNDKDLLGCLGSSATTNLITTDDLGWANVAKHDAPILTADINLVSNAAQAVDISSMKKYCDIFANDATIALQNSQGYEVSSKYQKVKDDYELAVTYYRDGAEKASSGCDPLNPELIKEATALFSKGTEYIELAIRELSIAQ